MKTKKRWVRGLGWSALCLLVVAAVATGLRWRHSQQIGGKLGDVVVVRPALMHDGAPLAVVVLYAMDLHEGSAERRTAQALADRGALVALVDAVSYLRRQGPELNGHCGQLAAHVESMNRKLMRRENIDDYMLPVVMGAGIGNALARQAILHAPADTLAGAVAAPTQVSSEAAQPRRFWSRTPPALPDCGNGPAQPASGFLVELDSAKRDSAAPPDAVLADTLLSRAASVPRIAAGEPSVPLIELPRPGSHRLVILLSGDGGWRGFDQALGEQLNRQGVAVLGWDSLRYFWSSRTPRQTAADLARVMAQYRTEWQIHDIAWVGFSFGANMLPFVYNELSETQRDSVQMISLVGLAHHADFRIRVSGWMGFGNHDGPAVRPEFAHIPGRMLQCVHGRKEKDTLCPELAGLGVDVVETEGGHHLDGDYAGLAARIIAPWNQAGTRPGNGLPL